MRKTVLGALVAGAMMTMGGAANAGLLFDLNGAGAGGRIEADAFDWAPTSFLAKGGNVAIRNFLAGNCGANGADCQFDVLTHAKLTAYKRSDTGAFVGVPNTLGEITMVARYTEQVIAAANAPIPSATFQSTGAGWMEFYWSAASDSVEVSGANYNNGTLIGRLDGVTVGAIGAFLVTGAPTALSPINIDQTADGDQYAGQQSVRGTGSQDNLTAGTTGVQLDSNFFITSINGFSIIFDNISIGLPFNSANPADCFNETASGAAVGTSGLTTQCLNVHNNAAQMAGQGADGGYRPDIGAVNGLGLAAPDFIAQTDYNSAVNGVPEPGSLALLGVALAGLGLASKRRKSA